MMAERYYCADGNVVYVTPGDTPDTVNVNFRGNRYVKPSSIIGVKLFKTNPKEKKHGRSDQQGRDFADICNENAARNANASPIPGTVSVGNTVLVFNTGENRFEQYTVCCSYDDREYGHTGTSRYSSGTVTDRTALTDKGVKMVSDLSPIGNALLGCEKGQKVTVSMPDRSKLNFIVRDIMN